MVIIIIKILYFEKYLINNYNSKNKR